VVKGGSPLEQRVDLYRTWSSKAAELALAADHPGTKNRCTHSAGIWALIANAIESGQDRDVAHLTNNLLLLNDGCFVAAS